MTNGQTLQLRLSEIRQSLNELSGLDSPTDEQRTEMDTLATEYRAKETQWRAATIAEADAPETRAADGEDTERRALVERVELRSYLHEAATGRAVTGAEQELRAAVFGEHAREGLIPWEALLPRHDEQRADAATTAPTDVGASQASILGRVFVGTAASYLGVSMPQVGIGEVNYPVLSAGVSPEMKSKGAVKDAEAATISTTVLEPRRLTARYLFSVEDTARLRGMEEALRRDLSGALGEKIDDQILNGTGTTPNVSGFVNALTAPTAPTAVATFSDFVGAASRAVDGRYARNLTGVKTLVGAATYALAGTLMNTSGDVALSDYLIARSGGFLTSALIPAPPASGTGQDIQAAIVYRAARGAGSAVAPVWQGLELIRDPYTHAAKGQVSITAVMLWAFSLIRSDAYVRRAFKVS